MTGLSTVCKETMEFLTRHGMFSPFEPSGPFEVRRLNDHPLLKRDQMMLMHYGALRGPLYRDEREWKAYHDLVKSFCRANKGDTACIFEDLWGGIPSPLNDVLEVLPFALSLQNFQSASQTPSGRRIVFRASESCPVKDLPEPYGKYLQHCRGESKWDKPEELQIWMVCKLASPEKDRTMLRIEASTFCVPVIIRLAWSICDQLSIEPPLTTSLDYLRTKVTFRLGQRTVDLSRLS
ncbi:MAG TPA: hypothetical protein VKU01_04625 [Bryobacteraceae bacterium]|nr:hypothetical protein [Bryobacteraceae bacterium]